MGVRLVKHGLQKGAGTYYHNELQHRDLENQHPIESITGLSNALGQIHQDIELNKDHANLINRDAADQHPISAITGLQEALDKTTLNISDTPSVNLTYDEETQTLSGDVNISKDADNMLVMKADGMYAKKPDDAVANVIRITQAAHGLSDLKAVYMQSDGKYALASAAVASTSEVIGVIKVIDANTFYLVTDGYYATTALTHPAGTVLYLSTAGTLSTTPGTYIIKPVAVMVAGGIQIAIKDSFLANDFTFATASYGIYYDYTTSIRQTYPFGTVVEFDIDIPYNKFKLRGFEILMGRSHDTGSVVYKDVYDISIRKSKYDTDAQTDYVVKYRFQSGSFIGFTESGNTISVITAGGYWSEGQTGFSSNATGFVYEDHDCSYKIHVKLWLWGMGSSGNTWVDHIKTYIQTIPE